VRQGFAAATFGVTQVKTPNTPKSAGFVVSSRSVARSRFTAAAGKRYNRRAIPHRNPVAERKSSMPRTPNKKVAKPFGAPKATNHLRSARPISTWQPHLCQYDDQRVLTFGSAKDLDAAIDLLWTGELRNLPHETPDGRSLIVPAEAVDYFARAGLRFTEKTVRPMSDLPAAETRRLRR
jgi:hypothetical protein